MASIGEIAQFLEAGIEHNQDETAAYQRASEALDEVAANASGTQIAYDEVGGAQASLAANTKKATGQAYEITEKLGELTGLLGSMDFLTEATIADAVRILSGAEAAAGLAGAVATSLDGTTQTIADTALFAADKAYKATETYSWGVGDETPVPEAHQDYNEATAFATDQLPLLTKDAGELHGQSGALTADCETSLQGHREIELKARDLLGKLAALHTDALHLQALCERRTDEDTALRGRVEGTSKKAFEVSAAASRAKTTVDSELIPSVLGVITAAEEARGRL